LSGRNVTVWQAGRLNCRVEGQRLRQFDERDVVRVVGHAAFRDDHEALRATLLGAGRRSGVADVDEARHDVHVVAREAVDAVARRQNEAAVEDRSAAKVPPGDEQQRLIRERVTRGDAAPDDTSVTGVASVTSFFATT
jgi:hypothetical protein